MAIITGNFGNDILFGTGYNDTILGNDGNDILIASNGNDLLNGGTGTDTANYNSLAQSITLSPTGIIRKSDGSSDQLVSIEAIIANAAVANNTIDASTAGAGASINVNLATQTLTVNGVPGVGTFTIINFDDVRGTNANDIITGDSQNNQLFGNGGNDIFIASNGNDLLNGGTGTDTANYNSLAQSITLSPTGIIRKSDGSSDQLVSIETIIANAAVANNTIDTSTAGAGASINVNLTTQTLTVNGVSGVGTFTIINFDDVRGTNANDIITGDVQNNQLFGNGGNDIFIASNGNDLLNGGTGTDTANYNSLAQSITLSPTGIIRKSDGTSDQLVSIETIIANAAVANNTIDTSTAGAGASINVNLATQTLTVNGVPGVGTFAIINFDDVKGTNANDIITGDVQNNQLFGNGGNDIFIASNGNDLLNGGTGTDTANYNSLAQSITLLPTGIIRKSDGTSDQLVSIETIIANAAVANNIIDTSTAGAGASINVNLATQTLTVNGVPGVGTFAIINFDDVKGTNANDIITGDVQNNQLFGNGGNDIFIASNGNDLLNGGTGTDTANYNSLAQSITLSPTGIIRKSDGSSDQLVSIETIIANAAVANNTIDTSTAGAGASINVNLTTQTLTVNGVPGVGTFTIINFDDVRGTNANDIITGDVQNNQLFGNGGNDIFIASNGNDLLNGGTGTDTANYNSLAQSITLLPTGIIRKSDGSSDQLVSIEAIIANAAVANNTIDASTAGAGASINVNLATQTLTVNGVPGVGTFTIINFDDVKGTNANDIITGDVQNNQLFGNGGNDIFIASNGNDLLNGGTGTDTANYNSLAQSITLSPTGIIRKSDGSSDQLVSIETIIANAAVANNTIDTSTAGAGASINVNLTTQTLTVNGVPGVGTFTIINFDDVRGTNANDIITGDSQNNQLFGNGGNDYLDGGLGNDIMNGGLGNDNYVVDSIGDVVIETYTLATEIDQVQSSISYTLGANLENLSLLGNTAINGTGNALNNTITGNIGNNILNGYDGNDIIFALAGDDIIIAGNGNDQAFGDTGNDILYGENGNDILYGEDGNDTINGGNGNDYLVGGAGNDIITGGASQDVLVGGIGSDRFNYRILTDSVVNGLNIDLITDFNANLGNDLFLVSTARSVFNNLGNISVMDSTTIAAYLNNNNFIANSAVQFTVGSQIFVGINDGISGFNPNTDAIIEVTGLIGTLSLNNFTTI